MICNNGDEGACKQLLQPLLALGDPVINDVRMRPYLEVRPFVNSTELPFSRTHNQHCLHPLLCAVAAQSRAHHVCTTRQPVRAGDAHATSRMDRHALRRYLTNYMMAEGQLSRDVMMHIAAHINTGICLSPPSAAAHHHHHHHHRHHHHHHHNTPSSSCHSLLYLASPAPSNRSIAITHMGGAAIARIAAAATAFPHRSAQFVLQVTTRPPLDLSAAQCSPRI